MKAKSDCRHLPLQRTSWSLMGVFLLLSGCGQAPTPQQAAAPTLSASSVGGAMTVSGAVYTSTNPGVDGSATCLNGRELSTGVVNCNIYPLKDYVWLSGGPSSTPSKGLENGRYFFSILEPGGQFDPKDGAAKNLSDDYDTWKNRVFTFAGGKITSAENDSDFTTVHHTYDPVLGRLRAFPYADTTNPGGEYILAVCSLQGYATDDEAYAAIKPSNCKYDAFKVRTSEPPQPEMVTAVLNGFKYRDDNLSGTRGTGETTLEGWEIALDCGPAGTFKTSTLADGSWSKTFTFPFSTTNETTCTVTEILDPDQRPGWRQTGNTSDESTTSGPATVTLADKVYQVTLRHNDDSSVYELNFGNVPLGTITGSKRYQGYTATSPIKYWKVTLSGTDAAGNAVTTQTTYTDDDGLYSFTALLPGQYTVTESMPTTNKTGSQWFNVTPLTIPADTRAQTKPTTFPMSAFLNVCQRNPGGRTIGFWSNRNGATAFTTIPNGLSTLVGLNLRDGAGKDFNPGTYAQVQKWLLNATATNMAYMLSAQLTATTLNSLGGFTNAGVSVYAKSGSNFTWGPASITQLMTDANTSLGAYGLTPDGHPQRALQEIMKTILDRVNNSGEGLVAWFDQPDASGCTAINTTTTWTP
ncbi:hypothetical protein [Deinococcus navajonensis]|uniref:Prealbumin-like fold domain-containing protein n=1 Tax=Deinococcus navajonensis TaxID=309884 RepID=A0ABV8XQE5_9DEIO